MDHKIKIKIADRTYRQVIHSEGEEAVIREAARSVSEKIASLSGQYTGISAVDILTIVALNESIEKLETKAKLEQDRSSLESLSAGLQDYVDSLK